MTDRKKPGVAFWATVVVVVVLVGYPLSFGPACWVTSHCGIKGDWLFFAYAPMIWTLNHGPDVLFNAVSWYSLIGAADGWGWEIDFSAQFVGFGPRR
jgi:hypothetical protein